MNRKTINQMTSILSFFQKKQDELQSIIGKLSLNDVKNDDIFASTTKRIKESILMKCVLFKEPSIRQHRQVVKYFSPDYINPSGGERSITVVTVEYPFEGSSEVFGYIPSQFGYSSPIFYLPTGNNVIIEIETDILDKDFVYRRASEEIDTTKNLIHEVNREVSTWNARTEPEVDELLKRKREELINFYS